MEENKKQFSVIFVKKILFTLWKNYYVFILFCIIDFILNIIQAIHTGVSANEFYFQATYAENLKIGYLDFPPAISLFIKIGTLVFGVNAIGIRCMGIVCNLFIKIILWFFIIQYIQPRQYSYKKTQFYFFFIYYAITIFSFSGFITTPDSILLFFFVCTLLTYKKFKENSNLIHALLLGVLFATMCYSKYEGLIIVLLIIISNKDFLKNKNYIFSVVIFLMLYIPHMYWLYTNDFYPFQMIWQEKKRHINLYDFVLLTGIILGFLGPLVIVYSFYSVIAHFKIYFKQHKTLVYLFFGLLIFLIFKILFFSLKSYSNLYIFCPLLFIFSVHKVLHEPLRNIVRLNFIISVAVQFYLRIYFIFSPFEWQGNFNKSYKESLLINEIAQNKKVAFINSSRMASIYNFYFTSKAYNIESYGHEKTEYQYIYPPATLNGQDIFLVSPYKPGNIWDTLYTFNNQFLFYRNIKSFVYNGNIKLSNITTYMSNNENNDAESDTSINALNIHFDMSVPYKSYMLDTNNFIINLVVLDQHNIIASFPISIIDFTPLHDDKILFIKSFIDDPLILNQINNLLEINGNLKFALSVLQNGDILYINSAFFKLEIRNDK